MNKEKIRIGFLGNSPISIYALRAIIEDDRFYVKIVITNEDKPKGRKQSVFYPTPVAEFALENKIKVFKTNSINANIDEVKNIELDYLITCSFGQMLSEKVLSWPIIKPINIHTSILPKGRGGAPIHWAVINGEKQSGYSIMEMVDEMDAGDIFHIEKINLELGETYTSLHNKLANLIQDTFANNFINHVVLNPNPIKQDSTQVTKWLNVKKEDRYIDWEKSNEEVVNLINGLDETPSALSLLRLNKNEEPIEIKIHKARILNRMAPIAMFAGPPGSIFGFSDESIIVSTGKGYIEIISFTLPSKKAINFKEYLNGHKDNSIFKIRTLFYHPNFSLDEWAKKQRGFRI